MQLWLRAGGCAVAGSDLLKVARFGWEESAIASELWLHRYAQEKEKVGQREMETGQRQRQRQGQRTRRERWSDGWMQIDISIKWRVG